MHLCVNTDDPAVFPATIMAEHQLLRHAAIEKFGVASAQADIWLERIRRHGEALFHKQQAGVRHKTDR
ncbi:hypothetical protein C882_3599 [Caenispirillum salinarum AK4]|uniref:Adenosine deaminase n=1 Tax=Caenispirillum salinarum AK4 TaxID=1238182 RepID=K9H2N4_9PROT|nr:hypothetical protein [Caenispirillum salinarum]EKV31847.1 hypothetical protein C882_3599 [Caenispirillum salinarum AK4]